MNTKAERAVELHKKDIFQHRRLPVAFYKERRINEEEMFRISEGFGLGMGMMEMCGALSGMTMIIGLENSVGDPEKGAPTKTHRLIRLYKNI